MVKRPLTKRQWENGSLRQLLDVGYNFNKGKEFGNMVNWWSACLRYAFQLLSCVKDFILKFFSQFRSKMGTSKLLVEET